MALAVAVAVVVTTTLFVLVLGAVVLRASTTARRGWVKGQSDSKLKPHHGTYCGEPAVCEVSLGIMGTGYSSTQAGVS